MMTKRNVVVIALAVLIGLFLFYSVNKQKKAQKIYHNYLLKGIEFSQVNELSIKDFTVKRSDNDTWKIDNITCNKHEVEYLVNLLKSLDFKNLISENPENFKKFRVDDNSSLKVSLKTFDGKVYRIFIGKITPDGNGCYVRFKDRVYLITENIKIDFNKTRKDFYLNRDSKK